MRMTNAETFLAELAMVTGYTDLRVLPTGKWAGVGRFLFTHAIMTGRLGDFESCDDRWCYHEAAKAQGGPRGVGRPGRAQGLAPAPLHRPAARRARPGISCVVSRPSDEALAAAVKALSGLAHRRRKWVREKAPQYTAEFDRNADKLEAIGAWLMAQMEGPKDG
jgi:hypothetical protein